VPDVDARILRAQQGAVAVILLAAFVFQLPVLIPVAALLPGLDAVLGAGGPSRRFWRGVLAARMGPARTQDSAGAFRTQSLAVFTALVIATLVWLAGLDGLAFVLAILVALLAALCATGLFNLGTELDRRKGGGKGPRR
jgi:hypothetical protein